jgi:hypothetical protein
MWHAIYNSATGALVSIGTVLADPLPAGLVALDVGETMPDGDWSSATLSFVARSTLPETWTKYEFKQRMTAAERVAVRAAAASNAVVADFMDLLDSSGAVVRANPNVLAGLNYLESIAVLATGRAAEIING